MDSQEDEQSGITRVQVFIQSTPAFNAARDGLRPLVDEIIERLGSMGVSEEYSADGLTLLIAALVEEHRLRTLLFGTH